MGFWAVAAPIIGSVVSGILGSKGAKKAEKRQEKFIRDSRANAVAELSPEAVVKHSKTFMPGMFSSSGGAPAYGPLGHQKVNPQTGIPLMQSLDAGSVVGQQLAKRASGGPVAAGQPVLVGEKGPEVIQSQAPGTVMPAAGVLNQPTQPGIGSPTPMPQPVPMPTPGGTPIGGSAIGGGGTTAGGATVVNQSATKPGLAPAPNLGALSVARTYDMLLNPGQLPSAAYEREQEQANQAQNLALRTIQGGMASQGLGMGGLGSMLAQSAILNTLRQRNEANRDFTMAREQLKRQDINQGVSNYSGFLSSLFGFAQDRANAQLAGIGSTIPRSNTMEPWANFASAAGQQIGKYFESKGN